MLEVRQLGLGAILEIVPGKHGDERGFFSETYNAQSFAEAGMSLGFCQDNQSYSRDRGVLRGLHYQVPPRAQDKLIRVISGAIYDVAVDIRRGSPTFGKWIGAEISAGKWNQLLVPKGFAHGFVTLVPETEVLYKVSDYYSPEHDRAIRFDDPAIGIDWPIESGAVTLSAKDAAAPMLADAEIGFTYGKGVSAMRIMVTGGAGFIGSAVCRHLVSKGEDFVLNVDALTYAGNPQSLRPIANHANYAFLQADICDEETVFEAMRAHDIDAVMHLAAESHVDRSIDGPDVFLQTNVIGTCRLLSAARRYRDSLPGARKDAFRFHHVSTDEVYGDLPFDSGIFTEDTPYKPSSPYSASKAASDHFVRAWHHTFGLPVVLSNCSNNYGPFHFPEKLIPLVTLNALDGSELPIYGQGLNIRDWLHVEDHARALEAVIKKGRSGETYNIGGRSEQTNIDVVRTICAILDEERPLGGSKSYEEQIRFVTDRPGHDRRYAIDPQKIESELGWKAEETFQTGLRKTVRWYLDNEWWWRPIREADKGERRGKVAGHGG